MAINKNNIGTIFILTVNNNDVVVDVSTASTKQIIFKKPDGTTLVKTASFVTSGTDGKIKYTSISGDLDQTGLWFMQAYAVIGSEQFYTEYEFFVVEPNL